MKSTRMPEEIRAQIERRLRKGDRPKDIAASIRCHISTIHKLARQLKIALEPGRPRGETDRGRSKRDEAITLSRQGLSIAEIALQIDRSERAVYLYLQSEIKDIDKAR